MDLSFLKNEITFGMNKIFLGFEKFDFKPTYYVSVNQIVISQSANEIKNVACPKFLSHRGIEYFKDSDFYDYNTIFNNSIWDINFYHNIMNGWSEGGTVTFVALQLAYFMGFNEVILIGVDHNFVCEGKPNQEVVSKEVDLNHFHPDYFGKGVNWNLPDLESSEKAYRLAKEAYDNDHRKIIDATFGGKLAIFDKANYKDIFFKENLNSINLQAKLLAESGKINEAIQLFEEIVAKEPLHYKANFNLGILYYQQKELKKSAKCYLKCLETLPNDRNTVINLIYVLIEMNKKTEAEKIISTFLIDNYEDQEMLNLLKHLSNEGLIIKNHQLIEEENYLRILKNAVNKENNDASIFDKVSAESNLHLDLDYPTSANNSPRWGHGKEPHAKLKEIISRQRSDYEQLLQEFLPFKAGFSNISVNPDLSNPGESNLKNDWLPGLDALAIYGMINLYKPKMYLEVGSGYSTKFARRAISDSNSKTKIISIDPHPRAEINKLCDFMIRKPLELVDLGIFDLLGENDILFIDNSHRSFMNSDVTVFFLDILPRLKSGVLVQIHDICLPCDYPPQWDKRYYNEQYLLAAYLLAEGNKFKIILPNYSLTSILSPEFKNIPGMFFKNKEGVMQGGCSFWIRIN